MEDQQLTLWLQDLQDDAVVDIEGTDCVYSSDGITFSNRLETREFAPEAPGPSSLRRTAVYVRGRSPASYDWRIRLTVPTGASLARWDAVAVPRTASVSLNGANRVSPRGQAVDVVIYTTGGAIGTDALPLRSELVARALAVRGRSVLYVPFARVDEPGREYADGAGSIRQLQANKFADGMLDIFAGRDSGVFICSSKCDATAFRAINLARRHGWTTVYEVRDDMEAFNRLGFARYYDPLLEVAIARAVDIVVTVSEPLRQKLIAWGIPDDAIHVLPNGVSDEDRALLDTHKHTVRGQKAVYFGHLFPARFDYDLVAATARQFPNYRFHLYGPGFDEGGIDLPPNVEAFGQVSRDEFVEAASTADIGLLPFKANPLTFSLSPLKLGQYYGLALKVVSSDIFQIRDQPLVFSDPSRSFFGNFAAAQAYRVRARDIDAVSSYMTAHSWKRIIDSMVSLLDRVV